MQPLFVRDGTRADVGIGPYKSTCVPLVGIDAYIDP